MHRCLGLASVLIVSALCVSVPGQDKIAPEKAATIVPDPAATQLVAETRTAWARWDAFPGFTADVAVNLNGKITHGKVKVNPKGDCHFDLADAAARDWADEVLGSIVLHRLDVNHAKPIPCVFTDKDVNHPLGREVRVISNNDIYRIRDQQKVFHLRKRGDVIFTVTVQASHRNEDNKILVDSFVVNYFDGKTGAWRSNDAYNQTWQRVGKFDLPRTVTLVTVKAANKLEAGMLQLTNPRLLSMGKAKE